MPVNWEIRNSVVILTLAGHYSFEEPVQAVTEAMAAPRFQAGMALLIDARRSTISRSSDEFRERALLDGFARIQGPIHPAPR